MAVVAKVGDEILAKSDKTVLVEGNHYFPKSDVFMDKLTLDAGKHTTCHWKGEASYYDVMVGDKTYKGVAFEYMEPSEAAQHIKDRIAFWQEVEVGEE